MKLVNKRDERDSARKVSTAGFVIGGIGAAVGIFGGVMYWRGKKQADDAPVASFQIVPVLAPETQGLGIVGQFLARSDKGRAVPEPARSPGNAPAPFILPTCAPSRARSPVHARSRSRSPGLQRARS